MDDASRDLDDWFYVRCSKCHKVSHLAYDNTKQEFIAICQFCHNFTRLADISTAKEDQ